MTKSITDTQKNRGRPATGVTPISNLRLAPEVRAKIDAWIAEQPESKLAGFVIIERAHLNGRPTGHIVTLDVDPAVRRHGLGTLLMQTAEEQMKQEGAALMSLEVAENNVAARHFYRNLGFITRGKIAKYYGGTIDAEVMEKAI